MSDLTDDDLVRQCQQGSDDAFTELVGRYRRLVFGIIARTTGDAARAEDLAQDVFLRIYRGLRYFQGRARVSTWIYRIAVNVCLQERAAPTRIESAIGDERGEQPPRLPLGTKDAAFGTLELRDRLGKALARLPAELPAARGGALPARRAVRGAGCGPGPAARDGEDAPAPCEAAAATAARGRAGVTRCERR